MRRACAWLATTAVWVLAGCSPTPELTQIMVVVQSDIRELESVEIQVDGMGAPKHARAALDDEPLPRTLAVVHRGGPMGPIQITARGLVGTDVLVSRSARVSFSKNRNVALTLLLERACVPVHEACADDQTCIDGACARDRVDVRDLPEWTGQAPGYDAAVAFDASMDASDEPFSDAAAEAGAPDDSGAEAGVDADVDAGFDASTSLCTSSFVDCDEDGVCETDLATLEDCGGCGVPCDGIVIAEPHAALSCATAQCVMTCAMGYADLDGVRDNGCEATEFGFVPSNVDVTSEALIDAVVPQLEVDCDATVAFGATVPEALTICGSEVHPLVVLQEDGPEVIVIPVLRFEVAAGVTLRFTGARPVSLVVFGDAQVAGKIDVSAAAASPGAGGDVSCTAGVGTAGTVTGSNTDGAGGGGGGGGFGTEGARGGDPGRSGAGGAKGTIEGEPWLSPLRGGCAGGRGGHRSADTSGAGGGGGGALQLSVAGTLSISGIMAAAGGGGTAPGSDETGGGGGGSGGGVLLEANKLVVLADGKVTANGGSGSEGAETESHAGAAGVDGSHDSASPAPGGAGGEPNGGNGGNGAAGAIAAASGKDGADVFSISGDADDNGGGGGGGGVGRIAVRAQLCSLAGLFSPAPSLDCNSTTDFAFTASNVDVNAPEIVRSMAPALIVSCDATIDTGSAGPLDAVDLCGTLVQPTTVTQADASEAVVVAVAGLTVQANTSLRAIGQRPLVLVVFGDASIAGGLDVGARGALAGAGGRASCSSGAGAMGIAAGSGHGGGGGGGAGFGNPGAPGGASGGTTSMAAAGMSEGEVTLSPLLGGCPGGRGGTGDVAAGGLSGAAGGALQVSVAGQLLLQGFAAAGGGGGQSAGSESGGGGGGSGGALLLEASVLNVSASGFATANGGGGAAGTDTSGVPGEAGSDGLPSSLLAAGGGNSTTLAGRGGGGAAAAAAAQPGSAGDSAGSGDANDHGGGGGGGGVGRIRVRGVTSCTLAGTFSPSAATTCP